MNEIRYYYLYQTALIFLTVRISGQYNKTLRCIKCLGTVDRLVSNQMTSKRPLPEGNMDEGGVLTFIRKTMASFADGKTEK